MGEGNGKPTGSGRERGNRVFRFLDRYIGIPLLFLLGLFKRKRRLRGDVTRIALLKTAAIGDTVLISAIVQDLRRAWPSSRISFFCGASNYEAARLLPGVDEVIRIPVARPLKALSMMRGGFDLLLDFGQWPRLDAILAGLSSAAFCVGFRSEGQFRHYLYDVAVSHSRDCHELENFRALLSPLGLQGQARPKLFPATIRERNPLLVVVHMFAGGIRSHQKEWPRERWQKLLDHLLAKGYRPVLTGSRENRPSALELAAMTAYPDQIRVAAGELDLPGLVELLSESALLVSVNTGVMHLGAALDCPLVALNGPTSVLRWGPLATRAMALESPRPCSPCLNLGFEYGCAHDYCMRDLTPKAVLDAVDRMLAG